MSLYTAPATSATIVDGSIVDADVNASAAIAGTKISPDFGAQNVTTNGTSTAASFIPSSSTVPTNGVYLPAANTVGIASNSTKRIDIDASGNVAVDTNTLYVDAVNNRVAIGTTSPGYPLTVAGTINISGRGTGSRLLFSDWSLYNSEFGGSLVFDNGSERARIDGSGRLLVGTSSSRGNFFNSAGLDSSLQIEGTTYNSSSLSVVRNVEGTGAPHITLGKTRSASVGGNTAVVSGDAVGIFSFQGSDGSEFVEAARITTEVDGTPGANSMPGRIVLSTTPAAASGSTERMRIDNVGRTFFGTAGLVSGFFPSHVVISATSDANGLNIHGANSAGSNLNIWAAYEGSGTFATFSAGTTRSQVGSISHNGTATSYNTSSDYRLKENVTPVTDGITRLQQLKPSRFNFIAEPGKTVDGFIAHEVQTIVPEAITGEKDAVDDDGNPIYQGIDQSKLVPLLTAALQEAVAEINALKDRVAALEGA